MYSLVNYINSWWIGVPEQNKEDLMETRAISNTQCKEVNNIKNKCLISANDLVKVKLKPIKDIIPSPARNMPPIDKFQLHMLNQAQLKEILNVKLRPTPPRTVKKYEHNHPVLRELLQTVKRV
jgi:hypothetical protein